MKIKTCSLVLALSFACAVSVQAAGNPQAGETKSAACAGCHGPDGNSPTADFPKIAGQGAGYIEKQLREYKSGKRSNPIMMGMVAGLSDQDMADLAAYFASRKITATPTDQGLAPRGKSLYKGGDTYKGIAACTACHGPDAKGNPMARFPHLGGQYAAYTEKTLKEFRDGTRANDPNEMMRRVTERMSDSQIKAVAAYLSAMAPASASQPAAAAPAAEAVAEAPEPAPAASKSGDEVIKIACAACHATGAAGAPKLGDTAAWKPRAEKGMDVLMKNAINGLGAMPPRGGHMNLTDEEMRNAVVSMLERAGINP